MPGGKGFAPLERDGHAIARRRSATTLPRARVPPLARNRSARARVKSLGSLTDCQPG